MSRAGGNAPDGSRGLQACLNDLIGVMALPALWSGREPSAIVGALLEGMVEMLQLEFAFARLNEKVTGSPGQIIRAGRGRTAPQSVEAVALSLLPRLQHASRNSRQVAPNPVGEGTLSIAFFPLGILDELGLIVIGSDRPDFPTIEEELVVQVAVNQAAIGLQEARRLGAEISERQRAEGERVKLASIIENSADFIGMASLAGDVLFVNPAGRLLTGFDGDEAGRHVSEFVPPHARDRIRDEIWPSVLREGHWDGEVPFAHFATGAEIPMHTNVFLIVEPGNSSPVAVATISRDITQRKQSEAEAQKLRDELAESANYLAEGQRLSHTASWAWDMRTGTIFWSREHFHIWGMDPDGGPPDYEGAFKTLHPDDQARVKEEFEAAAAIAGDYESEFRIARPDGAIRHIHSLGHPVRGDRGEILEYVGTVIDVTERKRSEEALAAARAALAHVARVTTMGELTASIAHEVNQPLAAVAANANACLHWLAATPPNMAEAHGASQRIIRDANRASDVIRGIRAFLMRGAPQNCALHLDELLREVADMVLEEARAKGVAIVVAAPNGAPSVRGDRIQLQQVILNLLVNAVDAVGAVQGRARTVELAAQRHGQGQACVTVRDSGPGLDPRFRERVFDAFYTTKPHGMGMGLAISRTIVETHGGRLWCTPNEGGSGETFHFTIPTEGAPSA